MLIKYIFCVFIFGIVVSECKTSSLPSTDKTPSSKDEQMLSQLPKLPKEIFILIGRGQCCKGHIISINKDGGIKYAVGTYDVPISDTYWEMPDIYNPDSIKLDDNYSQKFKKLPVEKIIELGQLIEDEGKLRFQDKKDWTDAYLYNIYLDKKKVAYGYRPNVSDFPKTLQELIRLIENEVEMHELPHM